MISTELAAEALRQLYGLEGRLESLPGEYDANFLVQTGRKKFVFKIMRSRCDPGLVDLQCALLDHLAERAPHILLPRVHRNKEGERVGQVAIAGELAPDGAHIAWLLRYVPGRLLADTRPHTPELLESLGRLLGEIDAALADFSHPFAHRDFQWDPARPGWIRDRLEYIEDPARRDRVEVLLDDFERNVAPGLSGLPASIIYGDANDYNVLVEGTGYEARVVSVVDFGDAMHTVTACEAAIAATYASLGSADPLAAAASVVRGYHAARPLQPEEIEAIWPLLRMRLCESVTNSAYRKQAETDDPYVTISERPAWTALDRVSEIHPRFAHYALRDACGLEPVPCSAAVTEWLRTADAEIHSVLDVDVRDAPSVAFELGVGSLLLGADPAAAETSRLAETLSRRMTDAAVTIGIGGYDEARLAYTSEAFSSGPHPTDERRTIHLGIDLFSVAGTPVHAPLSGAVHLVADNAAPQDYGPLVILRHEIPGGPDFFTLYGHLDRETRVSLAPGDCVDSGQRIGAIGAPPVNGNWPPHLHFQLITDLLELDADFPGVAPASQRSVWLSLSPDPNLVLRIPKTKLPERDPTPEQTLARRRAHLGSSLSISYRDPIKAVRGWMQYLYDHAGRAFLDLYNNVPHVGHSHPRVVAAVSAQTALLTTNTRYLHDNIGRYAERLADLVPDPLVVCYFVNSASEANELALRLARTYTRRESVIVLESAYHGHTTSLIDISPYKFDGPGGRGPKSWVHVAPLPDDYRGPYRRDDPEAGARYAGHVAEIANGLSGEGREAAAFIAETLPSVGGQIVFPPGYLDAAYRHARAAGAVCIADEVQVGFGRLGTHFWGFETQGVVPDIVVLGKPIANGYPLGAVITTRAIADAFDTGMEFFSTFGGNPVACGAGMAVLDVIERDRLQQHARRLGERLLSGLRRLQEEHAVIGDVRGSGLFIGVELVRDRETLEPAEREAAYVVNRLRDLGVLTGTDGPYENVIKIRGPLAVTDVDVDRALESLDRVLREDAAQS